MSDESADVIISETWPRRRRCALDDAMLTIAGCSKWLERSSGNLNGLNNPAEPLAKDAPHESPSQRRDRAFARTWRLRIGPEAWNELHQAYTEAREDELKAENTEQKGTI